MHCCAYQMSGLVGVVGSHRAPPNAVRSYGIRRTPPDVSELAAPADDSGPDQSAPSDHSDGECEDHARVVDDGVWAERRRRAPNVVP